MCDYCDGPGPFVSHSLATAMVRIFNSPIRTTGTVCLNCMADGYGNWKPLIKNPVPDRSCSYCERLTPIGRPTCYGCTLALALDIELLMVCGICGQLRDILNSSDRILIFNHCRTSLLAPHADSLVFPSTRVCNVCQQLAGIIQPQCQICQGLNNLTQVGHSFMCHQCINNLITQLPLEDQSDLTSDSTELVEVDYEICDHCEKADNPRVYNKPCYLEGYYYHKTYKLCNYCASFRSRCMVCGARDNTVCCLTKRVVLDVIIEIGQVVCKTCSSKQSRINSTKRKYARPVIPTSRQLELINKV